MLYPYIISIKTLHRNTQGLWIHFWKCMLWGSTQENEWLISFLSLIKWCWVIFLTAHFVCTWADVTISTSPALLQAAETRARVHHHLPPGSSVPPRALDAVQQQRSRRWLTPGESGGGGQLSAASLRALWSSRARPHLTSLGCLVTSKKEDHEFSWRDDRLFVLCQQNGCITWPHLKAT